MTPWRLQRYLEEITVTLSLDFVYNFTAVLITCIQVFNTEVYKFE